MNQVAGVGSQGLRCLLWQSIRPRVRQSVLAPSPHPSSTLPSTCRNVTFGKALNKKKRAHRFGKPDANAINRDRISDLPNVSPPTPPNVHETLLVFKGKIEKSATSITLHGKFAGWGLRGVALKELLDELEPSEVVPEGRSPRRTIGGLLKCWSREALKALEGGQPASFHWDLDNIIKAFGAEGERSFDRAIVNSFLRWLQHTLQGREGSENLLAHLDVLFSIGDLRHPPLKYPSARSLTRQIHLHVGPTNSGKTHGALLALCKANTGLYAGPLRLLAHEVWDRINTGTVSGGVAPRACNLKTGEEVKVVDELAGLEACTVEMVNFNKIVDVAVIDEIQMIGDSQRGQAWTAAVHGIPAKEMHLCGENSVIPLIKRIAEACGDTVHIHEYKRLTPLAVGPSLEDNLRNIKKGDCLVAFSRSEIFRLKSEIEGLTKFKCALAYGALPPETKAEQAKLFNDPDNDVSVMVASDAIGMGLNLRIKRVIFATVQKWNGTAMVPISASQIKQIAGRAGRYGTTTEQEQEGGFVTTMNGSDLPVLEAALAAPLLPINRAVIQPSSADLALLSTSVPSKAPTGHKTFGKQHSMQTLLQDLQLLAQVDSSTYLSSPMEQQFALAPLLEKAVPTSVNLSLADRELFALAPTNTRDERLLALFSNMIGFYVRSELIKIAECDVSMGMLRTLRSIEKIQEKVTPHLYAGARRPRSAEEDDSQESMPMSIAEALSSSSVQPDINTLMVLESLHRGLSLYLWLSFRLPLAFCYTADVERHKARTESAIAFSLEAIKVGRAERLAARAGDQSVHKAFRAQGVRQTRPPRFGDPVVARERPIGGMPVWRS